MYVGTLFKKRLEYATRAGWPFFIVSAKYGLLAPSTLVAPYDLTISDLSQLERCAWTLGVAQALIDQLSEPFDRQRFIVELHLGAEYAEPLRSVMPAIGISCDWPVRGLSQGEQMRWYTEDSSAVQRRRNPALIA